MSDEAISASNRRLLRREKRPHHNDMTESVAQALDLCLACKGCKAECPSGVDMAKLKYEFENHYYKTHRRPLRDYAFGYFHVTAKLASSIALLSNAVMQVPLFKNLIAKILGVTTKRPFPKFVSRRSRFKRDLQQNGEKIIFLSDPFARYIEPQVEQAAFDLLAACGYDVHVLPVIGAGASLLSKGFVEAAKRHAEKALDALNQLDPTREAVIVGIEPPDIYCLKNDYVDLLPQRRDEIASRTARTWLLDEYLLRSERFLNLRVGRKVDGGEAERNFSTKNNQIASGLVSVRREEQERGYSTTSPRNDGMKIKFQPHCHQRAEGLASDGLPSGTNATVELLRVCGYDVEVLDTGCCGMAGTFGYEAEHYDLSMQVGELKLFPLLRTPFAFGISPKYDEKNFDHNESSPVGFGGGREGVVATGAACRMQIEQGAGVDAVHPIELVAKLINGIIK